MGKYCPHCGFAITDDNLEEKFRHKLHPEGYVTVYAQEYTTGSTQNSLRSYIRVKLSNEVSLTIGSPMQMYPLTAVIGCSQPQSLRDVELMLLYLIEKHILFVVKIRHVAMTHVIYAQANIADKSRQPGRTDDDGD